ncbi:hypothetical protein GQ457_13G020700 [Hibiscus cannabinus]
MYSNSPLRCLGFCKHIVIGVAVLFGALFSIKLLALLPQNLNNIESESPEAGFHGASILGAVYNLSTIVVGAGIMALPATVNQLGLIPGLMTIIFVSVLTESSIDNILRFSRASKSATYSGVATDAFGGVSRKILQAYIVINNAGMLVVYMIIIGDVSSGTWEDGFHRRGVMEEWFDEHWWTTRSAVLFLTTLFVFVPLVSFKHVNSLRYTSALSVGLAVLFVAITAGVAIVNKSRQILVLPTPNIIIWSCSIVVLPIENELKDPTHKKLIVRKSLVFCTSSGMLSSSPAQLSLFASVKSFRLPSPFGEDTHGVATKNDRLISWMMIFLVVATSDILVKGWYISGVSGARHCRKPEPKQSEFFLAVYPPS